MDVKSLAKLAAGRCWAGYEPVPGKKPYSDDSCRPVGSKKKKKEEKKAFAPDTSFADGYDEGQLREALAERVRMIAQLRAHRDSLLDDKSGYKKAADPRMAMQTGGGSTGPGEIYQKTLKDFSSMAKRVASGAAGALPSVGKAIGGSVGGYTGGMAGQLGGMAAGQQLKHEAGNLGVALGGGGQTVPTGLDLSTGSITNQPSSAAVQGAIENQGLRQLLNRIKSGAANTPCSCNCGDTVSTCKCGPSCKCRKQGGSCYKPEKMANVLEALAGGLSSGVSALTDMQRKQAEEKEKLERAVARYTRERLARRIAADKVASEKEAGKKGLWANIHAKRKRGEKPAKPGDKDYPDSKSWSKTVKSSAVHELAVKAAKSPAWQRSEGKNSEGGLNAKGRASYNKATGGNLKAPVTQKNPKGKAKSRRASFCARMGGMKSKLTGEKAKNDPDSRINKALRKWNC